jgi:hypothetical protein
MNYTQVIMTNMAQSVGAACATLAEDRGTIEAECPGDARRSDVLSLDPACVPAEGTFPIAIRARDGRRVQRAVRSRWTRTGQGCVGAVQVLCGRCSAPLESRDLPYRTSEMFSCHLACTRCSWGVLACGCRRTLDMVLRVMIAEADRASRRGLVPIGHTHELLVQACPLGPPAELTSP